MSRTLRQLTERQMQKALAEGKLSRLEGAGKPLPDRAEAAYVDAGEAAGYRMMAEAGVRPEEFALKEALAEALAHLAAQTDPAKRKPLMARVAEMQLKYDMAVEARRAFMR